MDHIHILQMVDSDPGKPWVYGGEVGDLHDD